jgi:hypothetical protein
MIAPTFKAKVALEALQEQVSQLRVRKSSA